MQGINAATGERIAGVNHLRQSIRDILTTPIGSRVMRRDYGSRLIDLIDAPTNRSTMLAIYSATAEALAQWEPRFKLEQVRATAAEPGRVVLDLVGLYLPNGQIVTLDGIEVS